MKDIKVLLYKHEALQNLANHYNRINWTLHSILLALQAFFLKTIILEWTCTGKGHCLFYASCSLAIITVFAWMIIYLRHKNMIIKMYEELQKLETKIEQTTDYNFKVNLALKEMDMNNDGKFLKFLFKTHYVIISIQVLLIIIYVFCMYLVHHGYSIQGLIR